MFDPERLRLEQLEMHCASWLSDFTLKHRDYEPSGGWTGLYWMGRAPNGYVITAEYSHDHPSSEIMVWDLPRVSTHHRYPASGRLCLMEPSEWSPDFTAPIVITLAYRFILDVLEGRAN